jgi:hypothetical protein
MRKHPVWQEHPLVHGHDEWVAMVIAVVGFIICWGGVGLLFAGGNRTTGFVLFLAGLVIGGYGAIRGGHAKHDE